LKMYGNKKIEFLPESPNQMYENLLGYNAGHCSIKQIAYKNFRGLVKLKHLHLYSNQIETIPSDTFKDLASLERLNLRENSFFLIFGCIAS
jgi:Leucine-rich repeat (LRR) protein